MTPNEYEYEYEREIRHLKFSLSGARDRAEAAEARAAELEAELVRLRTAHAETIASIRELVDAYPEHDTVEAVSRIVGRMRDAEAIVQKQRDTM